MNLIGWVPLVLAVSLFLIGMFGHHVVRSVAPMLMRVPRTAVVLLIASLSLWLLAIASLSLMLTWLITGPTILGSYLTEVCQRCVAAASPFNTIGTTITSVPAVLLLVVPALALLFLLGVGVVRALRQHCEAQRLARDLLRQGSRTWIRGHRVLLLPDSTPIAYSLSHRIGGVVVSRGMLDVLDSTELDAVLAHEEAHVRQHHHLLVTILGIITWPLSRVPLVRSVVVSVPLYLEIAADNAAAEQSGTPALASALLKIGCLANSEGEANVLVASRLHMAGPDRISQLVAPPGLRSAVFPAVVLGMLLSGLMVLTALVQGPYLVAIISGC